VGLELGLGELGGASAPGPGRDSLSRPSQAVPPAAGAGAVLWIHPIQKCVRTHPVRDRLQGCTVIAPPASVPKQQWRIWPGFAGRPGIGAAIIPNFFPSHGACPSKAARAADPLYEHIVETHRAAPQPQAESPRGTCLRPPN